MTELNVNLPNVRYTQNSIKDKTDVEIKLLTNDVLTGKIMWQDPDCLFIADADDRKMLIYRHAIAYVRPQG